MNKPKTISRLITLLVLACLAGAVNVHAQTDSSTIYGYVLDAEGNPLNEFPVYIDGSPIVRTNAKGRYEVSVLAGKRHLVQANFYETVDSRRTKPLKSGESVRFDFKMEALKLGDGVVTRVRKTPGVIKVNPRKLENIPAVSIEEVLSRVFVGVVKRSELSSTYNVRGGNFDENLVYVNDIEVYRPFLARSGQQEGMSFINPYMTKDISFSSGGFEARYGDKLSSVLDVQYSQPKSFAGSVELSLLGASVHIEDRPDSLHNRFTYVLGARYRSLQYLLGSLDVSGDYRPRFTDFQALFGYRLNSHWTVNWFSTYARNQYRVVPQDRETNFGTVQKAVRLSIGFAGAEQIQYQTFLNALSFEYRMNDSTRFKLIGSSYNSEETERYTIEGAYRLEELETNLGSSNFAEARSVLGYGYFINHARNALEIEVSNIKGLARIDRGNHKIEIGAKIQQERIYDLLKEWDYNDSAGYRINAPNYPANEIHLDNVIRATNELKSYRVMGYAQDNILLSKRHDARLNLGVRSNYWSLNGQNLISPRAQFVVKPNKSYNDRLSGQLNERLEKLDLKFKHVSSADRKRELIDSAWNALQVDYDTLKRRELLLRVAAGVYVQPPFYRELRNSMGVLNRNLKAQESYHLVLGSDMMFKAWNRQFRLINELYYKHLENLVPYTINNVKLRYDAVNSSRGYAYGFDTRVNGEFIRGLESWVNLSLLSTKENISYVDENGEKQQTGYIRRPTDQRVNFSILFQDELPTDTTFKFQLNLVVGSKMPYYFNGPFRYSEVYRLPAYRRVDVAFSKVVKRFTKSSENGGRFNSIWMSLEVFNLLQVNNVASYLWVEDLNNNLYGVPNYLTGRRLNFKIIGKF